MGVMVVVYYCVMDQIFCDVPPILQLNRLHPTWKLKFPISELRNIDVTPHPIAVAPDEQNITG